MLTVFAVLFFMFRSGKRVLVRQDIVATTRPRKFGHVVVIF